MKIKDINKLEEKPSGFICTVCGRVSTAISNGVCLSPKCTGDALNVKEVSHE